MFLLIKQSFLSGCSSEPQRSFPLSPRIFSTICRVCSAFLILLHQKTSKIDGAFSCSVVLMCAQKSPFYNTREAWSLGQDSSTHALFWFSSPLPHLALLQLFFTWDFLHLLYKVASQCARESCQLSTKVVKLAEPDSRKTVCDLPLQVAVILE